ncbi:hypothetical protein sscle_07g061910 [Sclerotinia sclerotiorum 1980 UF-70]|uniref:Uncharacterized protein n=1 Tax=Sclerotinia sclerotiorum (strain ATCC 18683 / 1980 / Ss-1) TaxID=665079 RepID=A0A1D9Q907_SCLS1|nr:hypothetical protein sscle_07g061910 [Sclerotinia sclerotiorum 1980 UF-70]
MSLEISYVLSTSEDIKDVVCIAEWPVAVDENEGRKIPTKIAYLVENKTLRSNKIGFDFSNKCKSYTWTKLLLDRNAPSNQYDDVTHVIGENEGIMVLPQFQNAKEVCTDFLREMYSHFSTIMKHRLTAITYDITPMDFWITLPAIWSEEAKDTILKAAKDAEPEAAGIATLKELAAPGALNAVQANYQKLKGGDNFLICDFGGGTVDISTYKVTMVVPNVEFEELCVGTGAKCGSTFLDSRLHALLFNCFGRAFKGVQYYGKGPGGDFMTQWEYAKKRFGYNMESWQDIELSRMRLDFPNSKYYNSLEHFVVLTKQDMESIFDPIVESIIGLLQRQLIEVRVHKKAKIHRMVLVGGLGSSKYLYDKLSIWCRFNGEIEFLCPKSPQTVVLRGAAIRGLEEIAPRLKYARIHYGFQIFLPFREGKYREEHAFIGEFDNDKYCEGRIQWCLSNDQNLLLRNGSQLERIDDPGVELVGQIRSVIPAEFNYGVNSKSRYNPRLKKMVHLFYLQVHTIFGDRGANLKFRIAVGGRAISDATIDFPRY